MTTMNMYLLIEIRHDILMQYPTNYGKVKKFNYMLEISLFFLGGGGGGGGSSCNSVVLRGDFGLGVPKRPCWLRPCPLDLCLNI